MKRMETKKYGNKNRQSLQALEPPFVATFLAQMSIAEAKQQRVALISIYICCSVWNTHLSKKHCKKDNKNFTSFSKQN